MNTENISEPSWKNIQERAKRIAELERKLAEAYHKIQSQGEALFFKDKEIKALRAALNNLHEVIDNDSENEAAARKATGQWDRSDTYGVEPLADIIERLVAAEAAVHCIYDPYHQILTILKETVKLMELNLIRQETKNEKD